MGVSMDRWKGKVAIVTGASAGIGAAIAEKLVRHGVKVVGLARRKEKIEELAKKLTDQPGKLYAIKADITKEEDILGAFDWIKSNLGPVHILVNNAGILTNTNLVEGDTRKWKEAFDTNVLGLCIATREAVKDMRANKVDGHIIHMNGISGHVVTYFPQVNVAAAAKHAITALTETLRQELNSIGSKIRITSLSPGVVRTEIIQSGGLGQSPELAEFMKGVPMLACEDVADATVYVVSTPPHVQIHEMIIKPVGEKM